MAKSIIEEDLRLNIVVNGDNGRKELYEAQEAVKRLNESLEEEKKVLQQVEREWGKTSQAYMSQQKVIDETAKKLSATEEKYKSLNRQQQIDTMTMSELQRHIRLTNAELKNTDPNTPRWKQLNKELADSKIRFQELADKSKKAGNIIQRAWSSAAGAVAVVAAGIRAASRVLRGFFEKISGFEQANANLSTILGKNVKDINDLTEAALELGRTTEYTASEVTLLQTELAKLGFNENQILRMEEPILHFATAVGATLPEAASLAGATLRIFDLNASETEDVLGSLAVATNKSALNFSYLQTSMSIVGPVANTFGIDVKDTTALLGSLADAGFDASSAATATRNILLNLANANGKLAKEIGKPVKTFPELIQALQDLDAKGLSLSETLGLTDKRSVSAFNRFLAGADSAAALREALEDTDGELERIANERLNTLEGSVKLLKSAWEGLILTLRESTGVFKAVVDWATKAITAVSDYLMGPDKALKRQAEREIDVYYKKMLKLDRGDEAQFEKDAYALVREADEAYTKALADYEQKKNRKNRKALNQAISNRDSAYTAYERALANESDWEMTVIDTGPTGGGGGGDDDKKKKSWSLQSDQAFLEAKLELTRQYNAGEIKDQEAYNEKILELEISSLTARLALRKESGTDRLQLEQQLLEKVHQQQENAKKKEENAKKKEEQLAKEKAQILAEIETDAVKKAEAQEDARFAEEQKKYKDNADMLELIEKKHQQNLAKIKIDAENTYLKKKQEEHDLERKRIENEYVEKIAAAKTAGAEMMLKREMAAALSASDVEYLKSLRDAVSAIVKSGELDGFVLTEDQKREFEKKLADIVSQINAANSALKGEDRTKRGVGGGSLFGVAQAQWEQLFRNLKEGKLGAEDLLIALNGLGGAAQQGFKLASQAIALTNAKEQEELKAYQKANSEKQKDLQKRLDAGLMTQAQYDAEVEKMQAEQDAKEEEMAVRQAEREKRMNISQAIIETALSVLKTYKQFGGWPLGVAPAAIMGAIGAAQVAMMAATPVTGREGGGFFDADGRPVRVRRKQDGRSFPARLSPDRRGWIDRPTVLVGENGSEYVIPSDALQNPSVRPFVDAIETARRSGRLRDLRLEAVQPRLAVSGRAAGGFFADDASDVPMGGAVTMPDGTHLSAANYQEFLQLLRRMNVVFSKPLVAEVSMLGKNGIVEKTKEYNRAQARGKLG